jgi:MFS family permease
MKYPPHLIVSLNGALQFCGLYAIYITFPNLWVKKYNWTADEVGYAYVAPGVAIFITSFVIGRVSDMMRAKAIKKSPDGKYAPERRIPIQLLGFAIAGGGKALYGWAAHNNANAALVLLGSALAAMGTAIIFVTSTSFQTECDPSQAASLVALAGLLRNLAAAVSSSIMATLVEKMGYGWCFTGLAAIDVLCVPGIILIMKKGADFRAQLQNQLKGA